MKASRATAARGYAYAEAIPRIAQSASVFQEDGLYAT